MTQLLIQKRTLLDGSLQRRPEKRKLESQCILPCDKNDDSVISIHLLNDDCLKEIFSHLSMVEKLKMSMVCKRCYNLSISSISSITEFMTAPDEYVRCGLFNFCLPRANQILWTLALIGVNLTKLQLSKVKRLDNRYLSMIARCCPNTLCCDFLIGRSI